MLNIINIKIREEEKKRQTAEISTYLNQIRVFQKESYIIKCWVKLFRRRGQVL